MLMSAQKQDTCNFTVHSDESDYELDESDTKAASPRIVGFYIEEQRNNAAMPNTSSDANSRRPQSHFNPGYGLAEWNRIRKRERNKRNREKKKQKRKMQLLHPGSIYPSTSELYNDQRLYNHESDENEPVSVLKTEEIIKPFSDEDMRRNGFDVPHIDEDEYTNPFSDYDGYRTESSPNNGNSGETVRNFAGHFVPVRKESENFNTPMVKHVENSRKCSTSVSSCSMSMDETTSSSDAQIAFTAKKVSTMNMPTASVSETAIDMNTPVSPVSENLEEGINDENMLASPMSESSDDTDGTQITMNLSSISKSTEEEKVDDRVVTINDPSVYQGLVDRLLVNRESSRKTNAFYSRENQNNIETGSATEYTSGWPRTNGQDIASLLQKTGLFLGSGQPHHDSDADYELFSGSILNRNGFVNRRGTPLPDVPQNHMNLGSNARSSNTIYDHGVSKKVIKAEYRQWEWVQASSEFSSKENSNEKYPMVKEMVEEESISSSDLHDDDLMSGSSISSSEEDLCAGSMQGNEPIRYVQQEHHAGASDSFDSEDISASDSNFSSVEDEQNKHVEHYPDLHASSSNSELIDFSSFLTQPRSDEITDLREQRDPLHSESFFSSQKNEHKLENDASTRSARTVNMDSTSMLTGFTTASKKQIYVSEDAIKKMAKRLDQDSERAADDNAVGVSMDVFDEENIFNDVRMRENAQVKVSVLTEDCVFSDGEPSNKSKEESNENGKRTRPGDTVDGESVIRNDRSHITGAKAEDTRNGRDLNGKQSKNRSDTRKQIVKELEASAINGMEKKVLEVSDETNKNRSISRIGGRIDICNSKFCVDGAQKENEPVVGANAKDKNKQNRIVKHASKDEIRVKMDDIAPINNDIITKNAPMRMYGKPVKGHTTLEIQKNRKIEEIYAKIAKKYKNQRKEWVDVQFKWAYLSCFKSNTLERDIADRMEKRRISEYSILRRIVEGDDVCFKLMCLMIVRTGSMLELYDGFYSLLFRADKAIQGRVVAQKLKIGDKIYVFNAELLTHEKDILAIDGPAFQMHSNSVMRVRDDKKLGYTKCASFLIKFTNVDKTGGLVPAIEFSIIKIVEDKVLIQCQGLKRAVDMTKLEEEMEYMKVLAVKHGVKEEFKLKRYCKLLVKDLHSCREGIFTWWNIREEIRIGDKIRAISTAIVNDTVGLHFNTINRSYVAKICWSFKRGTVSLVTGKILKDGGVRNRMYDLIVIGGGSGGIAAARETAKLGKRVLLIENAYLGGTCVNLGCVPKKITYNMTNIIEHMLLARSYGVYPSYEVDYGLFKECRDSAIRRLNIIYESMLGSNNVEVINGYARVIAAGKVEVNGRVHDGTHILLASGSKPKTLEIKGKEFVKYSDDFFYLKSIPKKTVIIGSGYISLEIAFMLALLGSEVSIILRGKRFLSHFDELFDSVVKEQLEKHRIRAYYEESVLEVCEEDRRSNNEQKETGEDNRGCQGTSTECGNGQNRTEQKENDVPPNEAYKNKIKQIKVVDVSKDRTNNKVRFGIHGEEINVKDKEDVLEIHKDEVRVEFEDERPRDSTYKVVLNNAVINNADFVMCAIGRDCDLSYVQVPINTHNSYAVVDEKFMTSVEGVYAVGDLIGPNHMLTPFAIFCARKLVRSLFEHEPIPADVYEFVPSVVFTHPPCASVGLSEQAAVARYGSVEVYETRFNNLIYALSDNKTSTVFKAIVHGGRVVGLHLFGNGVDEIVQGFAVGMKKGLSLDDLSNCVCVHPTAAEEVVTIGRVSPRRADK